MTTLQRLVWLLLLVACGSLGCTNGTPDASDSDALSSQPDPTTVLAAADAGLNGEKSLEGETIQQVLAIETENTDILLWLARTAHSLARQLYRDDQNDVAIELFLKAGDAMRKAEASGQKLLSNERDMRGSIYYDEACAFSLAGKPADALVPLGRAVEVGFGDIGMFAKDNDLDAVRALPEYPAFYAATMKSYRERIWQEMQAFESYPLSFDLIDLQGQRLVLAEMKGKVVVLDFWATWCGPCLMTIPHLVEIYTEQQGQGLEIVGLAYERGDDAAHIAKVESVVKEMHIDYPVVMGDKATSAQIPNLRSIPTMVFIDRAGRVRFQVSGAHSREYILAILAPLLAEGSAAEPTKAEAADPQAK